MASNWVHLTFRDASYDINLDQVIYMQRHSDHSTVYMRDGKSFNVNESPQEILGSAGVDLVMVRKT